MIDDILVFGQSQQEHDQRLESVLKRINKAGVTLNSEKCEFSKGCVKILGYVMMKWACIHTLINPSHSVNQGTNQCHRAALFF